MKKLLLLSAIIVLSISCTKEENAPEPIPVPVIEVVNSLKQFIDGTVTASHSYELRIYEDLGDSSYVLTTTNTYTGNSFPYAFEDIINNPFYFELTLHNSSTFSSSGEGVLNANIFYRGNEIIFLEADENTWSETFTSVIYNN